MLFSDYLFGMYKTNLNDKKYYILAITLKNPAGNLIV